MHIGPGSVLGGYRVEHTIGEGGMAIVHRAERLSDGETVVLKVLREELTRDPAVRRRFLRESRYAEALRHPNVVRVLDSGEQDATLYFAMQHIAGTDLYAMLEDGPLTPATTIGLLAQVAGALDAAHAIGLLHRDVKPGNVLVASGGGEPARCYLTDFGLSQQITVDSMALTAPGTFVGTLAYMAPEQMLGEDPGAGVDVYALGCVLFECLAGDPPFTGRPLDVMQSHVESSAPKLARKNSDVPRALDAVIARALAKDPGKRYATCTELVLAAAEALQVASPGRDGALAAKQAQGPSVATGPLELRVTAGNAEGAVLEVRGELLLGRGQPGPASLGDDPELSRRHALLRAGPAGSLAVEDLGSRNGTYVNGRGIGSARSLRPGDEIVVGASTLAIVVAATGAGVEHGAPPVATGRRLAVTGLSLRVTFHPEAGTATLQLDRESEPIALRYHAGNWCLAPSERVP